MSYYSKRRRKAGLSKSEVANALGIDYGKYELIDRGILRMPNRFMDRFNKIVSKTKTENVIEKMNREELVNNWWKEMCQKSGRGKFKLLDQLDKFNIKNLSELDQLLGYSSPGATSNYLNRGETVTFDLKNKYYSFFENELNIQVPKAQKETKTKNTKKGAVTYKGNEIYAELLAWYKAMDFVAWRKEHNIDRPTFVKKSGLSEGSVNNILNKAYDTPYLKTLQKLKAFVESYDNKSEEKSVEESITLVSVNVEDVPEDIRQMGRELCKEVNEDMRLKDKLTEKYETRIAKIQAIIEQHEVIIDELRREKEVYEKVLEDLDED